ncbi:MAG TPA: histidine triad nucleotide-binding protein [Ignavibacteriales bacterium]|nr:histidine triad nucleotide-binding protein [Ignavibacteriales bacterium]
MAETIFSKIIRKEIPAKIVYESDDVLAFRDINPQAPVHILVIPKKAEIENTTQIQGREHAELLGKLFDAVNEIARTEGIADKGFRVVINSGPESGQDVHHLHLHILGGRKMHWPPG